MYRKEHEHVTEANEIGPYWFFHTGSVFRYEVDVREDKRRSYHKKLMLRNIGFFNSRRETTPKILYEERSYVLGPLTHIDGAAAPEGCILIMTTKNPDALDPASTRPGRVDCKVAFQNADKELARTIFRRVTRGLDRKDFEQYAEQLASQIPDNILSLAQLHGFLLIRDGDISKVLKLSV